MDPRSFQLNTEMGLVITSPALAGEVAEIVERNMAPANAWQVGLDYEGRLVWQSAAGKTNMQPALRKVCIFQAISR